MTVVIVLLLVSALGYQTGSAIKCLQCTDRTNPFSCNNLKECALHEQCYVEQFVTLSGMVLYDMGCIPSQRCATGKRDIVGHLSRRQGHTGDVATCFECCHGDYCNVVGCGTTPATPDKRGPKCFDCQSRHSPGSCLATNDCDIDQVCALFHVSPLENTWSSRCMGKLQCAALINYQNHAGKRSMNDNCTQCCTDDFCNDRCTHTSSSNITAILATGPSIRCLQCSDMQYPYACTITTRCLQDEQCYVEQFITSDGNVMYNSGCLAKKQCSRDKRDMWQKRQSDIVTCEECCHGEMCNTQGCGSKTIPRTARGPRCFSCNGHSSPETCWDTQTCAIDEVCGIYHSDAYRKTWTSACMGSLQCHAITSIQRQNAIVGRRDTKDSGCPRCCTEDFCNASCHGAEHLNSTVTTSTQTLMTGITTATHTGG